MRFEQTAQWEQALKRAQECAVDPELVERRLTRNGVARHYVVYSPRSEQTYPLCWRSPLQVKPAFSAYVEQAGVISPVGMPRRDGQWASAASTDTREPAAWSQELGNSER